MKVLKCQNFINISFEGQFQNTKYVEMRTLTLKMWILELFKHRIPCKILYRPNFST